MYITYFTMTKDQRTGSEEDDRLILSSSGLPRRADDLVQQDKLTISGIAVKILGLAKVSGTYTESTGLRRLVMRDKRDEVIMDILPGPEPGTVEVKTDYKPL